MKNLYNVITSVLILVCLGAVGYVGQTLINMKQLDRSIEVTGIAEKQVVSDNVQWTIPIKSAHDNLSVAKSQVEADLTKVVAFLKNNNITDVEMERKGIKVRDNHTDRYTSVMPNTKPRYVADAEIVVKSTNIDQIIKASQSIDELISHNVNIAYDEYFHKGPKYSYSKFNEIDPLMMDEAVKQARKAAEVFSSQTGNKIGKIKEAAMDAILISSIGKEVVLSSHQNYYGGMDDDYGANMKLRVVAKVKYSLED